MEASIAGLSQSVRLQNVLELWYVWLASEPAVLCGEADVERIGAAVRTLRETGDFMEESSILKAEWFLSEGADLMMERICRGAYDGYE